MTRALCIAVSSLLLLAGCHSNEPEKKPVVDVKVQRAVATNVPMFISGPATVFGKSEARIAARITAPVKQLFVHKGDTVKKGQLLATLDNADLRAQSADANANLASAQANLQRTQSGTVPTELGQARADFETKAAAYKLAQRVREKRDELLAQGAISGKEAQVSRADEVRAKAEYDAARTKLETTERQTGKADVMMAQSNVAQARARQQLAIANLNFTELRSPSAGTVTEQTMFPGDMAKPDVPIFTVIDLSTAVARAQIDADQASAIATGQSCVFEQKEDPIAGKMQRTGKITVVNQSVDPARHTIEVWCEIPNSDHALKAGIFGSVKIAVGQASGAVVVPSSAVEFEEGTHNAKLYVVDNKNIAHLRKVQAIALDDDRVRVLSGLRAGEMVITTGEYGMPDETQVKPTEVRQ
ncbi:MAG: efflux RND transporter periplasmic adaptor subunit [Acidobacteria bacterium]|nr:efflux RND transporter periplasmic adaptor subunit [Acidobacteriota bacterium]